MSTLLSTLRNEPSGRVSSEAPTVTLPDSAMVDLMKCAELKAGWDGDRAPKPSAEALANASRVLKACAQTFAGSHSTSYDVGPSTDGGISVVVERRDQWVSMFCHNDGRVEIERSDGHEQIAQTWPTLGTDENILWLVRA